MVYAQIQGPAFSVVLDLEAIRPGEDESAAALRLLGRMRRLYGPRFFDAITVDAWYTRLLSFARFVAWAGGSSASSSRSASRLSGGLDAGGNPEGRVLRFGGGPPDPPARGS